MDPVQFLKCILFFSLDRIIIYGNKLYDLGKLVGLPVWFVGPYTLLNKVVVVVVVAVVAININLL